MEYSNLDICYEDFNNICRICLLSESLESFKELKVYNVLKSIRPQDFQAELEDILPKHICQYCIKDLENISNFLLKCETSDQILKSIIQVNKTDNREINNEVCEIDETEKEKNVAKPEIQAVDISKNNLSEDTEKKRITNKLFTCDYCSKTFERIFHLQEHINIHLGLKPFKCTTCGKCFTKRQTLKTHCYVHTGERPFKCKLCDGKSFLRKTDFLKHCLNIHNGIEKIDNGALSDDVKSEKVVYSSNSGVEEYRQLNKFTKYVNGRRESKFFQCTYCDKRFTHRKYWNYHVSTHKIAEESLNVHINNNLKPKNDNGLKSKCETKARTLLCNICGKKFNRKSTLDSHIKIHTGEKKFVCGICGFRFILKCTLNRHLAVHRNEKNFKCDICGKGLSQKRYLLKHIQVFHGTEKRKSLKKEKLSHYCSVCDRGFTTRSWLKRHESVHKAGDITHLNKENSKDKSKDFLCTECGKQFSLKCNLNRHVSTTHSGEKPFECNICGDRFTVKFSLDCHLNIHNGIKPYQCKHCSKSFRQPSSLRKHVLVHSGERQYKCHICEMAFKTNSHLKTHFKRHTSS